MHLYTNPTCTKQNVHQKECPKYSLLPESQSHTLGTEGMAFAMCLVWGAQYSLKVRVQQLAHTARRTEAEVLNSK